MKNIFTILLALILHVSLGATAVQSTAYTTASLTLDHTHIASPTTVWALLELNHKPEWHSYWKNPGDSGIATTLDWKLPSTIKVGKMLWGFPEIFFLGPIVNYGYKDAARILIPLTIAEPSGYSEIPIDVTVSWLVCRDICIPEKATFNLTLTQSEQAIKSSSYQDIHKFKSALMSVPEYKTTFTKNEDSVSLMLPKKLSNISAAYFFSAEKQQIKHEFEQSLVLQEDLPYIQLKPGPALINNLNGVLQLVQGEQVSYIRIYASNEYQENSVKTPLITALLFALLGGLILNIMPCVFPVLSLKVLTIVEQSKTKNQAIKQQGLAYLAGVLVTFYVLVLVLILLKTAGQQVGWGFQLQSPTFIFVMLLLMLGVGLHLSGRYDGPEWLHKIQSAAGEMQQKVSSQQAVQKSFWTGFLAVLIATPCTAPFMAPAIGFALAQNVGINLLVFTALGVGFAAPYVLVSFFPHLISFLPKPGAWMDTVKKILAYPMYLTAVWLAWVLYVLIGNGAVWVVLTLLVLIGVIQRPLKNIHDMLKKAIFIIVCMLLVMLIQRSSNNNGYVSQIDQLIPCKNAEQACFVDVTAAWCLTCKVNEQLVLNTSAIQALFKEEDIAYIVLDWTGEDPEITTYLQSFQREGVPLYIYYDTSGNATVLPQVLTKQLITDLVKK
ncbi:hypothetical protein DID76_03555 [Candidatus Marinamargulisbacteria bacterium SCGC AG-414-C22]|nr:hypothetical protein DID76_03555 [Candidatus Marinamargulisbacteria bacterium SCGC AG-414-C22]